MGVLAVESFVKYLDREVSLADGGALRADRGACTSARFHRFCFLKEHLAPSVVLPIRWNFMSILGRRVRAPPLSDSQKGVFLCGGEEYRAA